MFKARPINFRRERVGERLRRTEVVSQVGPLPWVAHFSEQYLKNAFPEFQPEAMGYRLVRRERVGVVSCYARPRWVWRLLKWFPGLCGG